MGTRADFYCGTGPEAEWLGSVRLDGNEWAEDRSSPIAQAKTADEFRTAVANMMTSRADAILPAQGWPWPWDDSTISDYTYYFADGRTRWDKRRDWPNMASLRLQ